MVVLFLLLIGVSLANAQQPESRLMVEKPSPSPVILPPPTMRPDFFLLGTAKSGSTLLYDLVVQHPKVVGAEKKELHFFNNYHCGKNRNLTTYVQQFPLLMIPPDERRGKVTGEASPTYCLYPCAVHQLSLLSPNAKVLFIVRDPQARTVAEWRFSGTRPFEQELAKEIKIVTDGLRTVSGSFEEYAAVLDNRLPHDSWHHIRRSMYLPQLKLLMSNFKHVMVIQAEQLFHNPAGVVAAVHGFLGLDAHAELDHAAVFAGTRSQHHHSNDRQPPPPEDVLEFVHKVLQPAGRSFVDFMETHPRLLRGVPFNASLWHQTLTP